MKIPTEKFFVMVTYDSLCRNLDLVARIHVNCSVYFSSHKSLDNYRKDGITSIRNFFNKNSLSAIVHGPFLDLNPGSLDVKIRRATLDRFKDTLEVARLLNSRYVTLHSGFEPVLYKKYADEWLKNSIATWSEFTKMAEDAGIKVHIENALEETPLLLITLVNEINSPYFNLCFDGGHFNAFSDTPPHEAFDMLPPDKIGEIHISDNDGSSDQHLPLGEGKIDLDAIFMRVDKLGINPIVTLEPNEVDGAVKSLEYLKNRQML